LQVVAEREEEEEEKSANGARPVGDSKTLLFTNPSQNDRLWARERVNQDGAGILTVPGQRSTLKMNERRLRREGALRWLPVVETYAT